MVYMDLFVSTLLAILVKAIDGVDLNLSADECLALGFRKSDLICTRCNDLTKFELDPLQESCSKCCIESEAKEIAKKYSAARLEVCGWKLGHYPQIQAFVKSDKSKDFPNLTIKYVRGAEPVIKLIESGGDVEEEMSIQKWDTDTIKDFLREHLL